MMETGVGQVWGKWAGAQGIETRGTDWEGQATKVGMWLEGLKTEPEP